MFSLTDYDYALPPELIAQVPMSRRDASRLLRLDRRTGDISHHTFAGLPDLLTPGDVLVVNNTAVAPVRLFGVKETGGRVEILILDYAASATPPQNGRHAVHECLVKAAKAPRLGCHLDFGPDLKGRVTAIHERAFTIEFTAGKPFDAILDQLGVMPLPPYIRRKDAANPAWGDKTAYQTVYARHRGAVAAPTAGLHFTQRLLKRLKEKGVAILPITLHVGYGTFMPVRTQDIRDHRMHSEPFTISPETADALCGARTEGRRIVAVGTTSVRTLEYASDEAGTIHPGSGNCDLFIYPGYRFKCVDAMITNFHLPRSSLIMLVSAFAGREAVMDCYRRAVAARYRFFSYGDAMLIV